MRQTTIFLTDSEQWALETINWPEQWSTVCETWLDITCWIGAHWSWFGKIHPWPHPLSFPSQGTTDNFRCAQAICFRHPWMPLSSGHHGKLCDTQSRSFSGFWGPSVKGSFEACLWQLSRAMGIRGCHPLCIPHDEALHLQWSNPCGERVLFLLPQLLHHLFLHPPPLY